MQQQFDVHQLKRHVDVEDVLTHYGVELHRTNGKSNGHCPFPDHKDRSPSFVIWIAGNYKGNFKCSCGQGDIVSFIKRMEDCSFVQALERLDQFSSGSPMGLGFDIAGLQEELNLITNHEEDYRSDPPPLPVCCRNGWPIAHYMWWRRNYDVDAASKIIREFDLMWCNDRTKFPNRDGDPCLSFNHTIIIPIYTIEGDYRLFQSQLVSNPPPSKNKLFPSSQGLLRDSFFGGQQALNEDRWCVVVEGFWDMARLWSLGIPAIGTINANFTTQQAYALIKNFDRIYLGYDNDLPYRLPDGQIRLGAGEQACSKVHSLTNGLVELKRMAIPPGVDPDGMTGKEIVDAIDNAWDYRPSQI